MQVDSVERMLREVSDVNWKPCRSIFLIAVFCASCLSGEAIAQVRSPLDNTWSTSSGKRSRRAPENVLSLIISGKDSGHLKQHLVKLARLARYRGVRVGTVYIVGGVSRFAPTETSHLSRSEELKKLTIVHQAIKRGTPLSVADVLGEGGLVQTVEKTKYFNYLKEAGVTEYEVTLSEYVFDRLDVKYSPTWVVRHLGQDYVFEGFSDPTVLFNRRGEFVRAQN